eukprot:TRINITY_DN10486_c0_g1_i2.p2 TRINITY_DN10486_c0_g1~~TRINITY_DN10486_c0_g1_i2.p2  ORF type:complete len:207 (+),score=17.01 TRINITY_DN10486_c0_g1_i2:262-882(+)
MPPWAAEEWERLGGTMLRQMVSKPWEAAATAARSPAKPAPTHNRSVQKVSNFGSLHRFNQDIEGKQSDRPNNDEDQGNLVFQTVEERAIGPFDPSPLDPNPISADTDMEFDHGQEDNVEKQPPSGLNTSPAPGGGDGQIGQHRPHVNGPHDENDHGRESLNHPQPGIQMVHSHTCLLYTSDAADDMQCVDLGGRRIIKKKKKKAKD